MKGLIFTYGLCYGGALISLFNPFVGLLIYVCFAIVKPEAVWPWSVPEGNYSRIVAVALLIGWAGKGFGSWRFGRARVCIFALIGFLLWTGISAAAAPVTELSWAYVEGLFKIVLPFLVGITTIDSISKTKQLVWVIVLSQGYIAFVLNENYFSGYNTLRDEGFGSLDNNGEAIALNTCIGMAFFLGLHEKKKWKKAVAFGMLALMSHAVLFSFSRGGMLGLILTGLVAFIVIPKRLSHFAILVLVVLIGVRLAGEEVVNRFMTIFAEREARDASAESRIDLWKGCMDLAVHHPILGVGPDHWPMHAPEYGFQLGKQAHTTWLRVGAEMGFPGLIAYFIFYFATCARLLRVTREKTSVPDPWFRYLARAVIASTMGFAVSAQFVSAELLEGPYYMILIGASVLKLLSLSDANVTASLAVDTTLEQS